MSQFRVWVVDNRTVMYIVDAETEEEAKRMVEASNDTDKEFGGTTKSSEWYVDYVEEC